MNPLGFPLLADENVAPDVVAALRERGIDVCTATEAGLSGATDAAILAYAMSASRVALTQDADFGLLAVRRGAPLIGVIFLRPGHIAAPIVLETIDTLRGADVNVEPPFVVVAERRRDRVQIRLRHEP